MEAITPHQPKEHTMSNKTNRSNPGCAIVALALAILGFYLLKRAGGEFRNISKSLEDGPGTTIEEPTPVPAIDPAEAARYRKEVEEVLADYSKELKLASDKFERGLNQGRATFAVVRNNIPKAVAPYKGFKKNCKLVKAVVTDKIKKTDKTGELVKQDFMGPVFEPALAVAGEIYAANATYRDDLEAARQRAAQRLVIAARHLPSLPSIPAVEDALARRADAVSAGCTRALEAAASAATGVGVAAGFEALFISQTVKAVVNLCVKTSAKAAGKAAVSTAAPAADGPFPFGDLIAVGGFIWTACDIHHMTKTMPKEMQKGLTDSVDKIEADTLAEVRGNARKVLAVYRAEEAAMRHAAYAALETGK